MQAARRHRPHLQTADDARMSVRHALAEVRDLPGARLACGVLKVDVFSHFDLHAQQHKKWNFRKQLNLCLDCPSAVNVQS